MKGSRRNSWRQKRQQSRNLIWSLPFMTYWFLRFVDCGHCRLQYVSVFEISDMFDCKSVAKLRRNFYIASKPGFRVSWNWHRVPKRRATTIWRRGNTQKNIYNIQITAKVWNQESYFACLIFQNLNDLKIIEKSINL